MTSVTAGLPQGIKVDQATQKGSVYDVIRTVLKKTARHTTQDFKRLITQFPEIHPRCVLLKINGKGRTIPVADAATLVEIAWLLPGKAATQFRRQGAESVCRLLGGDLTLVNEIQRRHAQVAGTAEEAFLLHQTENSNSTQVSEIAARKRPLDDDDEVYAIKKQQLLKQIKQEMAVTEHAMIKTQAQSSMEVLDILSKGALPPPPATLQLLQTIRHNVTTRLGSMIDTGVQALLAVEPDQQQQQQQQHLSVNEQAQRWTVQMYAAKMKLPAAAQTAEKLKIVGSLCAKIWTRERNLVSLEKAADGGLVKVWFEAGSNTPRREAYVPEMDPNLFAEARMKYSLAYRGGWEASDRASFDTWTYPAQLGAEVLQEAFQRAAAMA